MNREKLDRLTAQLLQDLGGAFAVPLVRIGEALGLYRKLHAIGPVTSAALADPSGICANGSRPRRHRTTSPTTPLAARFR
jgi:hypothetical protein